MPAASDGAIDNGPAGIATYTNFAIVSAATTVFGDIATNALATTTVATGTVANGDVSGRKVTTPATSSISITATGTANYVVRHNGVDEWIENDISNPQVLTSGGTVSTTAYDNEVSDPA